MAWWRFREWKGESADAGPPGDDERQDLLRALQRCGELALQRNRLVEFGGELSHFLCATRGHYRDTTARLRELCALEERSARLRGVLERNRGQYEAAHDVRLARSARRCTTTLRKVEAALADALTGDLAQARGGLEEVEEEIVRLEEWLSHQAARLDLVTDVIHEVDTRTVGQPGATAPLLRVRLNAIEEAVLCDVTCPMEEVHRVTSLVDSAAPADEAVEVPSLPAQRVESWNKMREQLSRSLQEATGALVPSPALEPPSVRSPQRLASEWGALRAAASSEEPR